MMRNIFLFLAVSQWSVGSVGPLRFLLNGLEMQRQKQEEEEEGKGEKENKQSN